MELREISRNDGITQLNLVGKLDLVGLQTVQSRFYGFTAAQRKNTIVDLTDLEFIGSLGIGMFISCAKTMAQFGAKMILVNPRPEVGSVLRMTGIDNAIAIVPSVGDAEVLLAG